MVFNDLKQLDGQMIQYYEVYGNKVTPRIAKIRYNAYSNRIVLRHFNKLGRYTNYDTEIYLSEYIFPNGIRATSGHNTKHVGESSMVIDYHSWSERNKCIYLQKEDAYNRVINKLREERRNIDKKMFALQKELYKK